jgi:outer membrane protein assembly factor BamB
MPVRTLLIALVAVAVVAAAGFGAERAVTTCGERFAEVSGEFDRAGPPEAVVRDESNTLADVHRRAIAAARNLAPGSGLRRLVWAVETHSLSGNVAALGDRFVLTAGATVAALAAADGRALWERELPGERAGLWTWRDGVVVLAGPSRFSDESDAHVAMLDRDGEMLRCETLDVDPDADRYGVDVDREGRVAVLEGGGQRTRLRLFTEGGRADAWDVELDGDFASVVIAGETVVVGDRARARGGPAAIGVDSESGERRWDLKATALDRDTPDPGPYRDRFAELDPSPRLARLRAGGPGVVGHALLSISDAGDVAPGRLLAIDTTTGKPVWRTRTEVPLRRRDELELQDGRVLAATSTDLGEVLAFNADDGRPLWRSEGGPGKELGDLIVSGERIYATGGRPAVLAARTGRLRELSRDGSNWFGLRGALGPDHLAILLDVGLVVVYERQ